MNTDNKRIAKNTVYLYIRMLVTICVSLYTSRVILDVLGLSDYGLYNVVGGTVTFFSFINSAMSGCTQRYLNIAIGEGNENNSIKVFKAAFTIHFVLSIIFFCVMLGVGWFMLENVLQINPGRYTAAIWVLIFSISLVCINFVYIPFDAAIVAHEQMNFYAFISILDAILKLIVVYILILFNNIDKLILFAVLNSLVTIVIALLYFFYCRHYFSECKLGFSRELAVMKEMFSFTGWNMLGNLTYMISTQGVNVVLNMFFGTVINAAWGVATQVNAVSTKFSSSIQTASSPQIMKLYASGNYRETYSLAQNTSKYVVYLMFLIAIPIFWEIDYILSVWLVDVPDYSSYMVRIMMVISIITASQFPITRIIVATGRIKASCIFNLIIQILFVLSAYFVLLWSMSIYYAMALLIVPAILGYIYHLYLVESYLGVKATDYFSVIKRNLIVFIPSFTSAAIVHFSIIENPFRTVVLVIVSSMVLVATVYYWGVDQITRLNIKTYIYNKIKNRKDEKFRGDMSR